MAGVLILDKDRGARKILTDILGAEGHQVSATPSAAAALHEILKGRAQVVLLGEQFDDLSAEQLIPVLKRCNRELSIILVATAASLPAMRKMRREGIFYYALKPVRVEDREEIRQAVRCAMANLENRSHLNGGRHFAPFLQHRHGTQQ